MTFKVVQNNCSYIYHAMIHRVYIYLSEFVLHLYFGPRRPKKRILPLILLYYHLKLSLWIGVIIMGEKVKVRTLSV